MLQMEGNNRPAILPDRLTDISVTLLCWGYFIFAFLFFFSFFYIAAFIFSRDRQRSFQYLDHLFFKGFLCLLRFLAPRHRWEIDPQITAIHGSIIVCNHRSYLDPLILISLLPRQKTIVKTKFFQAPVFGWLIQISGYLPSTTEGVYARRMLSQVESMGAFLHNGGNLFVFPEGTRNSEEGLGDFHKGVFKIARMYRCPIHVLELCNTDKLFRPGKFFFDTRVHNHVRMRILARISPKNDQSLISVTSIEREVRQIFESGNSCHGGVL